jgi:hypothetical protein
MHSKVIEIVGETLERGMGVVLVKKESAIVDEMIQEIAIEIENANGIEGLPAPESMKSRRLS